MTSISVTMEIDDLEACFGAVGAPGFADDVEAALAPDWIVAPVGDDCDASNDPNYCTLHLVTALPYLTFVPSNVCGGCQFVDIEGFDPQDCCDYSYAEPEFLDVQEALVQEVGAACAPLSITFDASNQPALPASGEPPFDNAEFEVCRTESYEVYNANADYYLSIDPSLSYISVTNGSQSFFAPMEGAGAAATGPARFLEAFAWADDATLGGTAYENWRFGLDHTMALDVSSGTFTIDPTGAPLLKGRGDVDGVDSVGAFGMAEMATGMLDSTNMVWDLDYTETGLGGYSMTVHLEGAVALP